MMDEAMPWRRVGQKNRENLPGTLNACVPVNSSSINYRKIIEKK
jgi:hypothetical protein